MMSGLWREHVVGPGKARGVTAERLTTFLHDPTVADTNNAAERALRPAVVMRKITGGSRSDKGGQGLVDPGTGGTM